LGGDRFKIVTVPSFALGVAAGNVVRARRNERELAFEATLEESGHSTVWASLDATVDERAFSRLLTAVGCGCFPRYGNGEFCIDVPPSVAWGPVAAALESERAIDVEVAFRSKRHSDIPTGDESERIS
jgi:hypothetical protein